MAWKAGLYINQLYYGEIGLKLLQIGERRMLHRVLFFKENERERDRERLREGTERDSEIQRETERDRDKDRNLTKREKKQKKHRED